MCWCEAEDDLWQQIRVAESGHELLRTRTAPEISATSGQRQVSSPREVLITSDGGGCVACNVTQSQPRPLTGPMDMAKNGLRWLQKDASKTHVRGLCYRKILISRAPLTYPAS